MFNLKDNNAPRPSADNGKMHPEDMRNMLVFFVLAGLLYFAYDAFVMRPQTEALKAHRIQAAQKIAVEAPAQAEVKPLDRAQAVAGSPARLKFDNPEISGSINLEGARIDDLLLKKYKIETGKDDLVSVLDPRGVKNFRTVEYGWIAADKSVRVPDSKTRWQVRGNAELSPANPVTLYWDNAQGLVFEQTLSLDENYMFGVTQKVVNNTGRAVTLHPYGLIAQRGIPHAFQGTWVSYEGPVGYIGSELKQLSYAALRKEKRAELEADQGWIGVTDKYWLTAMIPADRNNVKYSFTYSGADEKDKDNSGIYQTDLMGAAREIAPGQAVESSSHLFVGAKRVFLLEAYAKKHNIPQFDLAVDFGWFWFMTKPFFFALHYLGQWVGNMGVAIIIMTVILRGAVFPLTNASYRSFAKMKKVAPMVAELRQKYPNDKQKLQQDLIELYQREGVNPMSGCFPMLLQIPIFFALYKTFFVTIELRQAPFFGWIQDLTAPDPTSIFNLFGLIPWQPPSVLVIGVWPCLMLLAMLLQKQLNPPPQDPLQRDMAMYMPFMFAFMMSHFASGLVVYWTFSAYIGVIQQIIIMKSLNVPVHLFGETEEEKKMDELVDKGPAVHPLVEMVEGEVEEALFPHGDGEAGANTVSKPKPKKSKKKK